MDVLQFPRFDGKTPEEDIQQMKNFIFKLVPHINDMGFELERQIQEVKGDNNGNV